MSKKRYKTVPIENIKYIEEAFRIKNECPNCGFESEIKSENKDSILKDSAFVTTKYTENPCDSQLKCIINLKLMMQNLRHEVEKLKNSLRNL